MKKKKAIVKQRFTERATYYVCESCGKPYAAKKKPRSDFRARCGPCARAARQETKRATWHRHKHEYEARRSVRVSAS